MLRGILMIIALVSFGTFGQSNQSNEWQLVQSSNGVNIYSKTIECDSRFNESLPSQYAVLKIENTTSSSKQASYTFGLQYAEDCANCDEESEFSFVVNLAANQTIEGSCSNYDSQVNRIVKNYNLQGGWNFQHVVINNLIIE